MDFEFNDEQRMWREAVHEFVAHHVKTKAHQVDEESAFNWEAVRKMGPMGLLGLSVPEEYGGAGMNAVCSVIAMEELGWGCGSTALSIAAHNSLGCAPIVVYGTDEQKRRFLPGVINGRGKLAALALTEPGAGSDLKGGVSTKAVLKNSEWEINGSKMWCTNASIADYIITLVRTDPDGGSQSLSLVIVPTGIPGLIIGPPEKKMGVRGSPTNAVTFDSVRVPSQNLLGKMGSGLNQTLATLDSGRLGIGAISVGLARAAFDDAVKYASERKAFGGPIANQEAIQWMLADAATEMEAARWMVLRAAWMKDAGKSYTKEAAMGKLFATETAERVCRNAIQIFGGYGYSREYPVERYYRDARLMTIGEGTSEIQRLVIARKIIQEVNGNG